MGRDRALTPQELIDREKARLLREAAARAAEAAELTAKAASFDDRDVAELYRLAAKYNVTVSAPSRQSSGAEKAAVVVASSETIETLVHRYRTDDRSPYKKLRFNTRGYYDTLIKRILDGCADFRLADLKQQQIQHFYDEYTEHGTKRTSMGHALMTMFRGLINFGAGALANPDCERLSIVLHNMHFPVARTAIKRPTEEQVRAIIKKAHEMGMPSIALAQAFQWDCDLSQKDVIGEWVPIKEPGMTDIVHGDLKWMRGLKWEEIDSNLVLRHMLSHSGNLFEYHLRQTKLVSEELDRYHSLPKRGPIIVSESKGRPWMSQAYRKAWRRVAQACDLPDDIRNIGNHEGIRLSPRYKDLFQKKGPAGVHLKPTGRSR